MLQNRAKPQGLSAHLSRRAVQASDIRMKVQDPNLWHYTCVKRLSFCLLEPYNGWKSQYWCTQYTLAVEAW